MIDYIVSPSEDSLRTLPVFVMLNSCYYFPRFDSYLDSSTLFLSAIEL